MVVIQRLCGVKWKNNKEQWPDRQGVTMAKATATNPKEKLNKGAIIKLAEDTAKKTIKKETGKIARKEAGKVAAKIATEAALNPDFELNDEEEVSSQGTYEWEDDEDIEETNDKYNRNIFKDFNSGYKPTYNSDSDDSNNDNDDDDLSRDLKNRDIFAYSNDLMNKGTPVRLQIKKNGQFLTTIKKPYSEEQLQKDYGEGHYAVILRNDVKGTFIKQQSFSIAAPPMVQAQEAVKFQQEKQEEKIDKMFHTFSQMQSAQSETQQQLFERLMEEQRRREDEEKERRREEREIMKYNEQNNTNMLATVLQAAFANKSDDSGGASAILQIMQSQQQQTTQMIMESNKNFMMMIQEMRRDTQNMMEKITSMGNEQAREFRNQLSEMTRKKDDGFDAIKMFQMLNDSRESGMEFGLKINELAKQIAENEITPPAPKSIVESVLDNLGKFAPLMLATAQNSNAASHFNGHQAAETQTTQLISPPPQPSYKKPTVQAAPQKTLLTPKPTTIAKPVTQRPAQVVAQPKVVEKTANTATISSDATLKTKAIELCVPLIGHALQNGISSGDLGNATIGSFKSHGIELSSALRVLKIEDIYDLAFKTYSLPDMPELRNYLKEYYDYLHQKNSSPQELGEATRSAN